MKRERGRRQPPTKMLTALPATCALRALKNLHVDKVRIPSGEKHKGYLSCLAEIVRQLYN